MRLLDEGEPQAEVARLLGVDQSTISRLAAMEVSPMDDNHASAAYRRHLVETLVGRSIVEASTRAEKQ